MCIQLNPTFGTKKKKKKETPHNKLAAFKPDPNDPDFTPAQQIANHYRFVVVQAELDKVAKRWDAANKLEKRLRRQGHSETAIKQSRQLVLAGLLDAKA